MWRARRARLAPRPVAAGRRRSRAPGRPRAMGRPTLAATPHVLIAHHREERTKAERDDGAGKRPAMMRDYRLSDPLRHGHRQDAHDAAHEKQPAEHGDDHAPVAGPQMMHI